MGDRGMADRAVLDIRDLALRPGAAPIRQTIVKGEVLGLAGLDGQGQERFLKVLAGLERVSGRVECLGAGDARPITSFAQAAASRIVYVPRDRRSTGIFPALSILDNFAISTLGQDSRLGLISPAARRARYEQWRERLSIVAPRPDAPITALSGGNQQKILLARALARDPAILLLNDPTRGVDVATRHVLYGLFRDLAAEGMTLVILSSEIEEILVLCHRVLVFRDAQIAAELSGDAMTAEAVVAAMFGRAA